MHRPDPYDHFAATDLHIPDGVYRVVGTSEETVTLLRVADADERRVHTGEVSTLPLEELDGFTSAENPDGNRPLSDALTSNLEMVYWSIRVFVNQLRANRLPATVAFTLVLVGVVSDQFVSLPEIVYDGSILLGSLALAYIGSGRSFL